MPIALVGAPVKTAGSGTTGAMDSTGADLLLSFFSAPDGAQYVDATDSKGNADWVDAAAIYRLSAGSNRCGISHHLAPPNVGTSHTFSAATTVFYQGIIAAAFSGVDSFQAGSDVGVSNNAAGTSHITAPGTITPSANGALIVSLLALNTSGSSGAVTPPAGFTLLDQIATGGGNWPLAVAYMIQTTAAAITPTWTTGSSIASCGSCKIFLPVGGGGGGGGKPNIIYLQQ